MIRPYDTLDGLALRSMGRAFPITADAPSGRATFFHLPRRGIFGPADDPDSGGVSHRGSLLHSPSCPLCCAAWERPTGYGMPDPGGLSPIAGKTVVSNRRLLQPFLLVIKIMQQGLRQSLMGLDQFHIVPVKRRCILSGSGYFLHPRGGHFKGGQRHDKILR